MSIKNVVGNWNERISENKELMRVCQHANDVLEMRVRFIGTLIYKWPTPT